MNRFLPAFVPTPSLRVVLVFIFISLAFHVAAQKDDFELVRDEDGIRVYERWVNFPASDPPIEAREVKGVFTINATIAEALALLQDEKQIGKWQDHVSEFRVYKTHDTVQWTEYSYHDIPWPVSDQDHYLEYRIDPDSTPEKLFITFKTKVDDKVAPVKKGVTRMHLYGSWLLEEMGNGKIRATYVILSKPIGIPRIFTDPVIRSNLMTTIRSYIDILEKDVNGR